MNLDFLTPLTSDDFNVKTEFLIENFIPKRMITMIYANGGMGKSWLAMAIAKYAEKTGMNVYYLDYDNPIPVLKERGVEQKLITACSNLHYVHRSKSEHTSNQMLEEFEKRAVASCYSNTLIVLDSLRDFNDVNNDAKAMQLGERLKNIREAGATILALHHSNKDGRNYQGSNNLRNSIDNMYQLAKVSSPLGEIRWLLTVAKERAAITDIAMAVKVDDLSMMPIDINTAKLSDEEKTFVTQAQKAIESQDSINKKSVLECLGYDKRDKTANALLEQFDGIYWQSSKKSNVITYKLI